MKNKYTLVLVAGVLLLGLILLAGVRSTGRVEAETTTSPGTHLTADGSGTVFVDPDLATVTGGVTTSLATASEAAAENNRTMQALVAALQELGISEGDIQTTYYTLYPQYEYSDSETVAVAYQASNTVRITVRDLGKLADVIDRMTEAGANDIQSVEFDRLDKSEAYLEALQRAVADAQAKVEVLFGAAGLAGEPQARVIAETTYRESSYGVYREQMKTASADMGVANSAVLESARLAITALVRVDFAAAEE